MKKLLEKDKKLRINLKEVEKKKVILKSIFKNYNFSIIVRWNAFLKLKSIAQNNSSVALSPRCLISFNRKRFNKLTSFSRHIFLKLIRLGQIFGTKKSSW